MSMGPRRSRRRGRLLERLGLGLLALAMVLAAAAALGAFDDLFGDDDPRPVAKRSEPAPATTEEAPATTQETLPEEPESAERDSRREPVAVPFRRVGGGLGGRGTVQVRRTGGTVEMKVTARVPRSLFEIHLVKRRGRSKVLGSARDAPLTITKRVGRATLRRYRTIDVLARRLPARRGRGRERSLRVRTARLTRRLDRRSR